MPSVLLAHDQDEESLAEAVASPLRAAGYEVVYQGSLLVGDSLVQEASKALEAGSPVVLCGTVNALGTGWAHQVVNAARAHPGARVFGLQIEKRAYLQQLTLDGRVAEYWRDPNRAISELIEALQTYYPVNSNSDSPSSNQLERRYRELALRTYDIVDLANLPVADRNLATRELLLRSLYVSLRVAVDAPTGASSLEDALSAAEARRGGFSSVHDLSSSTFAARRWSVGERLGRSHRLVVLGDPGAGKSTLLRWIATAYLLRLNADPDWRGLPDVTTLPDQDWLPILVRCRDLSETDVTGPLEDILDNHLKKFEIASAEAENLNQLLLELLSNGRVLLLLDGLDEIVSPTARAKFCRQIEQISVAYPNAPIIATSRIVGYREIGLRIGRGFEHSTVLDLTDEDKDEFVRRWCVVTESMIRRESAVRELISDIHSTDRIERLTGNPMLLTTMALVKKKVGKLPSKRADLYSEAVQVLLNWRSEVDELLDPYEAMPQLEYIVYRMCGLGVQQLRTDEIISLLSKMRKEFPSVRAARRHEPLEFLQLLERRTGILVEAGTVRHKGQLIPVYEFRHLTFQEYLAGLALVAGRFPDRDRRRSLADNVSPLAAQTSDVMLENGDEKVEIELAVTENWREALRLCVTSCNDDDVDSVLLAIASPREDERRELTARPRAVLALSCLSDEPNASEDVAIDLIDRFAGILQEIDGGGRNATIADRAINEVSTSLWGPLVAKRVVMAWMSRPEAMKWLGGAAATAGGRSAPTDDEALKTWLMEEVHKLSSTASIDRICAALSIMAMVFTKQLAALDGPRQDIPLVRSLANRLMAMLKHSTHDMMAAAWALGWLGNTGFSIDPPWRPSPKQMAALVTRIKDPNTSATAAAFLLWPVTGDYSGDEQLAQTVANCIADLHSAITDRFFGNLIYSYIHLFPAYIDPIITLLNHKSAGVRSSAAEVLGGIGDGRAVEPLAAVLTDASGEVRDSVAEALGRIGDGRAVEPLAAVLTDASGEVRDSVIVALGQIGDGRAVEPLAAVLTDASGEVRDSVIVALGRIGDGRAVEPLAAVLTDASGEVRDSVIVALGRIGDGRAVEPLAAVLTDASGEVRDSVIVALGQIGDGRAVEPLAAVLTDASGEVRDSVIVALGQIGDGRAVEPLAAVLTDASGEVRDSVAEALGRIGDGRAVKPLLASTRAQRLHAPSPAVAALATLGHEEALREFQHLFKGPSSQERRAALWALASTERAQVDRVLLSRDADKLAPGIDPAEPIQLTDLELYISATRLAVEEIRKRYELLQSKYVLLLAWQ